MAVALGKFVYEIDQMPHDEYIDWMAFDRIETIGDMRADLRNAILCSLIANMVPARGKSPEPKDFMPFLDQTVPERQTLAELDRAMRQMAEAMGGKVVINART